MDRLGSGQGDFSASAFPKYHCPVYPGDRIDATMLLQKKNENFCPSYQYGTGLPVPPSKKGKPSESKKNTIPGSGIMRVILIIMCYEVTEPTLG